MVADDNSPDGTGKLADELAAADDQVHVMHRLGKEGLGAAYLAGFEWGINAGYDVLVEMDADGSHQPEQLPLLLAALVDADLVLGSRWVKGGQVVNWPKSREFLSRGGNLWTRMALGIPHPGRHRRLPRLPPGDPARPRPGQRRLGGLLLPGRSRLAGAEGRLPGRRGADHLRGAGARRLEDEPADRRRGPDPDHAVGDRAPGRAAAPAGRRTAIARGDLVSLRRGWPLLVLVVLLVALPIFEVWLLIQVGQRSGPGRRSASWCSRPCWAPG